MLCYRIETDTEHLYIFRLWTIIRTETEHLLFGRMDVSVRTVNVTDTDRWDFIYTSEILEMDL
jgi:hypothetical protein